MRVHTSIRLVINAIISLPISDVAAAAAKCSCYTNVVSNNQQSCSYIVDLDIVECPSSTLKMRARNTHTLQQYIHDTEYESSGGVLNTLHQ